MAQTSTDAAGAIDLIIVGGGFAGLTAALRATELGMRAVVLEQGHEHLYPCNSRLSGGILHMAMHDPHRDPEELIAIAKKQAGDSDEQLVEALASSGRRLIEWLQDNGVQFMRFGPQEAYRWCMAPPRAIRAGVDWEDRGPDRVLQALERSFVERGGKMFRGTRVESLKMQGGRCVGVIAADANGSRDWLGGAVLVADGGFQSNRQLFERYIGPNFGKVFQRGAGSGLGAGLKMCLEAGAAMKGEGRFYGHLLSSDSFTNSNVWPYPQMDMVATAGMVVDGLGQRIADEGRGGVFLTNTLARLSPGKIFAIIDDAIWQGPGKSDRIPVNPSLPNAGGTIHEADTIPELADKIGIAPARLQATIEEYNRALAAGTLETLAVPRSSAIAPWPIAQGPFRAIPVCPGITYTMSGIAIDGHSQVLTEAGQPIGGLFAAGATTGGLEGGKNAAYLGGLLKAGVFGLRAAERVHALTGRPAPAQATATSAHSAPQKRPSDRFPALRAVAKYGIVASIALGGLVTALVGWLAIPSLGVWAVPAALFGGAVAAFLAICFTELIRLITEFLIPA